MWSALLGALLAVWLALTFGVALGRTRWLLCTRETAYVLAPAMMTMALGLGFLASDEQCDTPRSGRAVNDQEWLTTIPSTLFAALTVQAATQLLMLSSGRSTRQMLTPCVAVHGCTTIYYLFGETASPSCVLITRWGTEVRPLHYTLWWVSMSAQLLTLNGLEVSLRRSVQAKQAGPRVRTGASAAPPWALRQCAFALACVPSMLVLTLYVDVLHGPVAMHIGVFGAFYGALYAGVYAPLAECSAYVLALQPTVSHSLAFRFRAVAVFLVFAWHIFPAVWALNILGGISAGGARMGYLVADLFAKFLPLSFYASDCETTNHASD